MHAAEAEIIGVHAGPRGAFVEHHQLLALLEAPQWWRIGADIQRLRGDVEEVGQKPPYLAKQHTDELTTLWHANHKEFFGGEAERMLLVHRRDVIDPVKIGERLEIGFLLNQLLCSAMKETDMRIDALHDLAIKLKYEPQHTVRRWMLRPEIGGEVAHQSPAVDGLASEKTPLSRCSDVSSRLSNCLAVVRDDLFPALTEAKEKWIPHPLSAISGLLAQSPQLDHDLLEVF